MPTEFNDALRMANRKKRQARNKADSNWVDLDHLSAGDKLTQDHAPVVLKHDFARLGKPVVCTAALPGGVATGVAGDANLLQWSSCALEYLIIGTQTIVGPSMVLGSGLDLGSMDQTNAEGLEALVNDRDTVFTVGTSPAFYVKGKFSIADASGSTHMMLGFRKVEAGQADYNDYADLAALDNARGDIKIETILAGAATTSTDTTDNWADGATHELTVMVSAAGVVTYRIDNNPPTTTAAFTFANGTVVRPFCLFTQHTDLAGEALLKSLECGFQL